MRTDFLHCLLSLSVTLAAACNVACSSDDAAGDDVGSDAGSAGNDSGTSADGGVVPPLVAHVQGQDDCYVYDFSVSNAVVAYGGQIEFTLNLTNGCSESVEIVSAIAWLTIHIITHGVGCCPGSQDLLPGQHVATLPMDGWDGAEHHQTLQPGESISKSLPWHPEADDMVNPDDAPPGFYDVFAIPPAIKRPTGDWREPLSKFLVVKVEDQ
ncbi:MAG: hypothetical protein HY897_09590 [Deltaproteobacteria bacterium]|nr:hypothetical protein [Deltaproteobacteria bacterium]